MTIKNQNIKKFYLWVDSITPRTVSITIRIATKIVPDSKINRLILWNVWRRNVPFLTAPAGFRDIETTRVSEIRGPALKTRAYWNIWVDERNWSRGVVKHLKTVFLG